MIGPKPPKLSPAELRRAERLARLVVGARDGGFCVKCRWVGLHADWDHRKNRSQGGQWAASNGQLLCGSGTTGCHGWVTANPEQAYREGWAVPGFADPLTYPARRWQPDMFGVLHLTWVLYDDAGRVHSITDAEAERRIASVLGPEGATR